MIVWFKLVHVGTSLINKYHAGSVCLPTEFLQCVLMGCPEVGKINVLSSFSSKY